MSLRLVGGLTSLVQASSAHLPDILSLILLISCAKYCPVVLPEGCYTHSVKMSWYRFILHFSRYCLVSFTLALMGFQYTPRAIGVSHQF